MEVEVRKAEGSGVRREDGRGKRGRKKAGQRFIQRVIKVGGKKEQEETNPTNREAAAKELEATSPLISAHLPLPPLGLHGPLHGRRLGRLDHPGLADRVGARLDGGVGHGGADLGRAVPVELAALLHLVDTVGQTRMSLQLGRSGVWSKPAPPPPGHYLASPGGFVVGLQVLVVVVELWLLLLLLLLQGHQVGVLLLQLPLQPL